MIVSNTGTFHFESLNFYLTFKLGMYIILNSNYYDLEKGVLFMKISFATGLSVLAISSLLVGCQTSELAEGSKLKHKREKISESHTHVSEHDNKNIAMQMMKKQNKFMTAFLKIAK